MKTEDSIKLCFEYHMPRHLLAMPTKEQMEKLKEATELLSKYVKDHDKITIQWTKHDPKVSEDMKKRLGLQ